MHIKFLRLGCDNGECRGDTCVCKPGFALDRNGKFCAPVCDPPCGKGNCTAPNTCSCNRGYELNANGNCIPKCTNGCQFGECVAPEKCDCRPGFVLESSICQPVCPKYVFRKCVCFFPIEKKSLIYIRFDLINQRLCQWYMYSAKSMFMSRWMDG